MVDYYTLSVSETIKSIKGFEDGLTKKEVRKRLKKFGYNELQKEKNLTVLTIFISQFKNALLLLLIVADLSVNSLTDLMASRYRCNLFLIII